MISQTLNYLLIINNYYTIFLDFHLSFNFRIPKLLSCPVQIRVREEIWISAEPRKLLNNLNSPESKPKVMGD
jgi:hypothetical protein